MYISVCVLYLYIYIFFCLFIYSFIYTISISTSLCLYVCTSVCLHLSQRNCRFLYQMDAAGFEPAGGRGVQVRDEKSFPTTGPRNQFGMKNHASCIQSPVSRQYIANANPTPASKLAFLICVHTVSIISPCPLFRLRLDDGRIVAIPQRLFGPSRGPVEAC